MSGNIAPSSFGFYPNMLGGYQNQVLLNDLCDMSLYPNFSAGMTNPMMGMNGSIFGGMPFTGGIPFMGGMNDDFYKQQEKYMDYMTDSQLRMQERSRNAEFRYNSPEEGVMIKGNILKEKIKENEQEQIIRAFDSYKESVRSLYGNGSEEEITNRAMRLYQQQFGISLVDDLRQYGNSSFKQGFLQFATLGLADKTTSEENISAVTGQPVSRSKKAEKIAGNALGGAALLGGGTLAVSGLCKVPFAKALKSKPLVAAVIGLVGALGFSIAKS